MIRWKWFLAIVLAGGMLGPAARWASAEGKGQDDLDEALRVKVTAENLHDLNQVVDLLESALEKGLEIESSDFAEQLLSESLLERAGQLTAVVRNIPPQNLEDPRMQRIRDLAVSDLRRVLTYDDAPPQATLMLAQLQALPGGDAAEAERLIQSLIENESFAELPAEEQAETHLLQAAVLRQQKKFDEALASLDKAIELAPEAPEPYQARGEVYRIQENYVKAIEQFDKVLELSPDSVLALIHRAEAHLNNKQADEALKDVETVLKANPGLALAHGLKAQALANQDRLPEAIAEMKELAESAPSEPEFQMQLALYYLVNKQPKQAIGAYSAVLANDDENFLALRGRADAYLGLGDHASAIADFERALKVEADDTGVLNNLAWVLSTSPDDAVRDGKRAIELATKACELTDFKQSHILSTLAAGYAETGDFETARKWSQQAVDMNDPEHGEQLAQELASYKEDKPWRERQTIEEAEEPAIEKDEPAPAESSTETPVEDSAAEETPAEESAPAEEPPATAESPATPEGD